ncbi:MAG: autotransporter outer membrane beta-barrel domain-containing protein [Lactobacillaceae bacterium]|jgi:outer membrane autotransporter protein|nr:autotransporter outer membrane beta-barrel domain-containing protein [Lactobacillaceae bacterium]
MQKYFFPVLVFLFSLSCITAVAALAEDSEETTYSPTDQYLLDYQGTLDKFHAQDENIIASASDITFTKSYTPPPGFGTTLIDDVIVGYEIVSGKVAPVYYTYTQDMRDNVPTISRMSTGNGNLPITGHFIGLRSPTNIGAAIAISYGGKIGDIKGDFIGNYVSGTGYGGAIFLDDAGSSIQSITGDFIKNYVNGTSSSSNAYGGAIELQENASIGTINGNFISNHINGSRYVIGGAIMVGGGASITTINGNFIGNYVKAVNRSTLMGLSGGAIYIEGGKIDTINGNFIGNYVSSEAFGHSGAVHGSISRINGDFLGNHVDVVTHGRGGAGSIGGANPILNGDFLGNYVKTTSTNKTHYTLGGAIFSSTNTLTLEADNVDHFMAGNYTEDFRGKIYNAIFVDTGTTGRSLVFKTSNGGSWSVFDSIEGGVYSNNQLTSYNNQYNINFIGDDTGDSGGFTTTKNFIKNDIINAGVISVNNTTLFLREDIYGKGQILPGTSITKAANAVASMSLNNGVFHIYNGYLEDVSLSGWSAASNSYLHLDVDTDIMLADKLLINGNVQGVTKLVVYGTSTRDIRGKGPIVFAQSTNDNTGSAGSFQVFRVYTSPYLYNIEYTENGTDKEWYFIMSSNKNDNKNPPPEVITPDLPGTPEISVDIEVASEVVGYIALHEAAVEQTRSMVSNVRNKIADNKTYCPGCGIYDIAYNGAPLYNVWASPVYHNAAIKKPQDMDANIYGLDGGFDIQYDANHKLGVFASYRKGNYDLSGRGKRFGSPIKSEIDINSYIGGLYYRYDKNNFWAFAAVYSGMQQADLSTKDGVKNDTDGSQFGGELDIGYLFPLKNKYSLEPNVGVSYTRLDFDTIADNFGKTSEYKVLGYMEAKLGLKLEKTLLLNSGPAKLYIEPSVILVFTSGDKVRITNLSDDIDTYDEGTLGRIEFGGRYAVDKQLSIFGTTNYTFGSNYDALSLNVGINYAW